MIMDSRAMKLRENPNRVHRLPTSFWMHLVIRQFGGTRHMQPLSLPLNTQTSFIKMDRFSGGD